MQNKQDREITVLDNFKAVLLTYARKIKSRDERYVLAPRGTEHVTIIDCYKLHQVAKKERAFMFLPEGIQEDKLELIGGLNIEMCQTGKILADKWREAPIRLKSRMNDKILFHYVVQKSQVYKKRNGLRSVYLAGRMDSYQLERPFYQEFQLYKELCEQSEQTKSNVIDLDQQQVQKKVEKEQKKVQKKQKDETKEQKEFKEQLRKMFNMKREQILHQQKMKNTTQIQKQYPKEKFRQYRRLGPDGKVVYLEKAPRPRRVYKKKIQSDLDEDDQVVISDHQIDPSQGNVVKKKRIKVPSFKDENQYDFEKMDSYDQHERRPRKKPGPRAKQQNQDRKYAIQRRRKLFAQESMFVDGQLNDFENSLNTYQTESKIEQNSHNSSLNNPSKQQFSVTPSKKKKSNTKSKNKKTNKSVKSQSKKKSIKKQQNKKSNEFESSTQKEQNKDQKKNSILDKQNKSDTKSQQGKQDAEEHSVQKVFPAAKGPLPEGDQIDG